MRKPDTWWLILLALLLLLGMLATLRYGSNNSRHGYGATSNIGTTSGQA